MEAGADVETKKGAAHPARVFRGYVSYKSTRTQQQQNVGHRGGLGCSLIKDHVKRRPKSLRGQTTVTQRRLRCLRPGPSEILSARRHT